MVAIESLLCLKSKPSIIHTKVANVASFNIGMDNMQESNEGQPKVKDKHMTSTYLHFQQISFLQRNNHKISKAE